MNQDIAQEVESVNKNTETNEVKVAFLRKRFGAFIIDLIIAGLVSGILISLFSSVLSSLGENLWYLGFILFGLYFGIFDSRLSNGYTPGKRILGIRLVNVEGENLSFFQSFLRYAIFAIPLFSSSINATLYNFPLNYVWLAFFGIIVILLFFGNFGLLMFFNKRGLHDYLTESVVVNDRGIERVNINNIESLKTVIKNKKTRFIIIVMIMVIVCIAHVFASIYPIFFNQNFKSIYNASQFLSEKHDIKNTEVGVHHNFYGESEDVAISVNGYVEENVFDDVEKLEELFVQIHDSVKLSEDLKGYNAEYVYIELRTGFDAGLVKYYKTWNKRFPEDEMIE